MIQKMKKLRDMTFEGFVLTYLHRYSKRKKTQHQLHQGKVNRLHNRIEPFLALFWALCIVLQYCR